MKRTIGFALIVIISFILQSTVCRYITFGSIGPNLLIIIAASFGFMLGKKSGIIAGFFIGLLIDVFNGGVLGFHALLYMYIGYFNGFFKSMFFKDDLKLQILLVAGSDLLYGFVYYVLRFLLRGRFHVGYYLTNIILPEVVYTVLLTIVLFVFMTLYDKIVGRRADRRSQEIA